MGTAVLNTRHVNGRVHDSQNFSSRSFHSSQHQKVSVGIFVEKTPRCESGSRNEDVTRQLPPDEELLGSQGKLSQQSRKKEASWVSITPICHRNSVVKKVQSHSNQNIVLETKDQLQEKHSVSTCERNSENIISVSNQNIVLETEDQLHQKHSVSTCERNNENIKSVSNQNIVLETEDQLQQKHSVSTCERNSKKAKSVSNQNIVLETEDRLQEKVGIYTCERNRKKTAEFSEVKGDAFAYVKNKGKVLEKIENIMIPGNSDSLRLKLWEVLGAGPSTNKEVPSLGVVKEVTVTPSIGKNKKMHDVQNVKITTVEQNSETIKINSGLKENPGGTMHRILTRSSTKKQAQKQLLPKLRPKNCNKKKVGSSLPPGLKEKNASKSVFSFEEKTGTLGGIKRGGGSNTMSRMRTRQRSNLNTSKVKPCKIFFHSRSSSVDTSEIAGNESARNKCIGMMHSSPNKVDMNVPCQSNAILEIKSQSLERRLKMNLNRPVDKHVDSNENVSCSKKNKGKVNHDSRRPFVDNQNTNQNNDKLPFSWNSEPQDVFQSPTFAINIKTASVKEVPTDCLNFSTEKNDQRPTTSKIPNSLCSQSSMSWSSDSDVNSKTFNDEYFSKSLPRKTPSLTKEESAGMQSSQSPKIGQGSDSSGGDEIANQNLRADKWFSDASSKEPRNSFNCRKRLRSLDDINITNFTTASPFGTARTEEMTHLPNVPKQLSDNDFKRAISQLVFVLEKYKGKIRTDVRKKNSEVLSSARNIIHLKLRDAESQIHADVGKFTGIVKLKRKRLESTFQEQEEKFNAIRENFKKEVNQHLVDCRGTVEELESFQMEVKTNAERQRTTHRKLLEQVEQSIKFQINDAETSIATTHKAARKKMNLLKHALKEWLTDCPLS